MTLTIRNLVDLTEAFQMKLATKLQSGPYAKIQQRHLEAMRETRALPRRSHTAVTGEQSAGSVDVLTPRTQGPWSRKTLLSIGMCARESVMSQWVVR